MTTKTQLSLANAAIGQDVQALHDIHSDSKNIAIYQRDTASLQEALRPLAAQSLSCKASGTVDEITALLRTFFKENLAQYGFLFNDVVSCLSQFQSVTRAASFKLLLATVSTNMCRKFHTDVNSLRMLCTYVGPGTLWIPDEIVDYKALRNRDRNRSIVQDESLIQQVASGDVVILKGALYPGANAVLHRSPTIEETGEKRLLLRIDTNETANLWT